MTTHTIKDKTLCITGQLKRYTHERAHRAITRAGGHITLSVGPGTDFLIAGYRPGAMLDRARTLGIPVLDEAEMESLLAGDSVEVDEVVVLGEAPVRDLIGEARAALDGKPTSRTWSAILELVDACAPEELPALIDFLEPQVSRWALPPSTRWKPTQKTYGVENAPRTWRAKTPLGELRVAPHHWIVEMLAKHDSPKHRLIHSIHVTDMGMTATAAAEVLAREHLTNLRSYDTARTKLTGTFWRKLRTLPSTRSLQRIAFEQLDEKAAKGAIGEHHCECLRKLVVHHDYVEARALVTLLGAELCRGVDTLSTRGTTPTYLLGALSDPTVLPSLNHLIVTENSRVVLREVMASAVMSRVTTFSIAARVDAYNGRLEDRIYAFFNQMMRSASDGPAVLDVGKLTFDTRSSVDQHQRISIALADAIPRLTFPARTTTLKLGKWYSSALRAVIAQSGLEARR